MKRMAILVELRLTSDTFAHLEQQQRRKRNRRGEFTAQHVADALTDLWHSYVRR